MSEYEIQVGSLEELALKRRERLKSLKRKAQATNSGESNQQNDETAKINLPRPTELLKEQNADDGTMEVVVAEVENNDIVTVMTNEMETMKTPLIIEEIDIQNLAPRKPDWDLKRGKFQHKTKKS